VEPAYASFRAADIPRVQLSGARINVVAGRVADAEGPMVLTTPTTFALVHLDAGAPAPPKPDDEAELGLYVVDGTLLGSDQSLLGKGMLAPLTAGSSITLSAATDQGPATVAIIGGKPAEQPMLFSGPFVMDTAEHLTRAKRDYSSGKMGRLDGVPF